MGATLQSRQGRPGLRLGAFLFLGGCQDFDRELNPRQGCPILESEGRVLPSAGPKRTILPKRKKWLKMARRHELG